MSTTDIKRVITSKTMVNFRHFEVEAPHGTSLTLLLLTAGLIKPLSARELIYRTGGQDKDSEDSALSNM